MTSLITCVCGALLSLWLPAAPLETPVSISNEMVATHPRGYELSFDVMNKSGKSISAYVVLVDLLDEGKHVISTISIDMISDPGREFLPNATRHSKGIIRPEKAGSHQVRVDYVKFSDGTSWGPDTSKRSLLIEGFAHGLKASQAGQAGRQRSGEKK